MRLNEEMLNEADMVIMIGPEDGVLTESGSVVIEGYEAWVEFQNPKNKRYNAEKLKLYIRTCDVDRNPGINSRMQHDLSVKVCLDVKDGRYKTKKLIPIIADYKNGKASYDPNVDDDDIDLVKKKFGNNLEDLIDDNTPELDDVWLSNDDEEKFKTNLVKFLDKNEDMKPSIVQVGGINTNPEDDEILSKYYKRDYRKEEREAKLAAKKNKTKP